MDARKAERCAGAGGQALGLEISRSEGVVFASSLARAIPISVLRRLRAIVLNGLVWGGTWFVGVTVLVTVLSLFSPPRPGPAKWPEGFELAAQGGVLLFVAGAAFSTVITFLLRGRRLAELSWIRFGAGGGVVSFFVLPTFVSVMRLLNGDGMLPVTKLLSSGSAGFFFGGIAAAGTLKLAQLADRYLPAKTAAGPELLEGDRAAPPIARVTAASPKRTAARRWR